MHDQLENFKYLWDGSQPQWALLTMEQNGQPSYLVVNTQSRAAKIIEDDVLAQQIIERMLDAGVRVVAPGAGF
ncbi:hypothetical protein C5O80_31075 [Burkholderia sp. SRS-46]|nr:hypothetical protein C5O80_31075 [Burkholderia sp. SRS-46]